MSAGRHASVLLAALWFAAPVAADEPSYVVESAAEPAPKTAMLEGSESAWYFARRIVWGPEPYHTTFAAISTFEGLFVRFDAVDPEPWHTMTRRDDHLWEEEVVEVFLDLNRSGRDYAEVEISPANVVCDVRMAQPSPDKVSDLSWDLAGLESRVVPLRDAAGKTIGWTAIALLPWNGFRSLPSASGVHLPPRRGDRWRFNVFRIERPGGPKAPDKDAVFAAWSPTGQPSFHVPSAFRDLVFGAAR